MHRNLWGYGEGAADKSRRHQKKRQSPGGAVPFQADSDTAIILALVLLLWEDNPDEILICMLLYILS